MEERCVSNEYQVLKECVEFMSWCRNALREFGAVVGELNNRAMRYSFMVASMWKKIQRDLRQTILSIHRDVLERLGVSVEAVERVKVVDQAGVLRRGYVFYLDVVRAGGGVYLLETRHIADLEDLEWFVLKCRAFEVNMGVEAKRRIFVAVNVDRETVERAGELGVDLVYGAVLD
ncbi:MAG: microtubule-binding protein [Pyrobaculum sp.]